MRKSSNSPLAAISLPSISHRRSGTAHRKSVQHERHELPWPDPSDQNADAHRHENDQGNIVHMQLKAQEMNRHDVNQINGEAGAGYDVDRPPKPRGERYARYIEQSDDGRQQPDEPVSPHRRIIPSAQHRRCDMQGDEAHRRQQRYRLPPWLSRSEEHTSELQSLMRISYAVFCLKKQ